jgi:Xaa-Pro dipeptidase
MNVYEFRKQKFYDWMTREGIALVMFEDTDGRRDPSVRWMTGHPGDALLFLSADQRSILVPWDINMANLMANADILIPYAEFQRLPMEALKAAAYYFKIPLGSRIEIPPVTPYPLFLKYIEGITDFDILCQNGSAHSKAAELRAIKDGEEQNIYRKASAITNEIIDLLEKKIRAGILGTEIEIALFIDAEGRKRGCEGMGFETIAAGPERSFGIHAFPTYTGGVFAAQGLSILDFGLNYFGYTTDVTLTFAREPLSKQQEKMLTLTEKAYHLALSMVKEGASAKDIAAAVDYFFSKSRKIMPHALGHGIGFEAHEEPYLRNRADNTWLLKPGMIFTLEPGLYDPLHGGCRLENDILLTDTGAEVLTTARIIRL